MSGGPDLRLVPAAGACWIGVVALTGESPGRAIIVGCLAAMAAIILRRRTVISLASICLATVAMSVGLRLWSLQACEVGDLAEHHRTVHVELQVRADPVEIANSPTPTYLVPVTVRSLYEDRKRLEVRTSAVAVLRTDEPPPSVGSRLAGRVTMRPSARSDVAAELDVVDWEVIASEPWWWRVGSSLRASVSAAMGRDDSAAAALVPALVAGQTDGIDELTAEDFRRSGLSHLLAVSGTNVTILLAAVLSAARALGARRRLRSVLAVCALAIFVLTARPDPSVLRAAAMGLVGLAGFGIGPRDGTRALAAAVIGLLFIDPWLGTSAGFVLSVCATAGIIWFSRPLRDRFSRWLPDTVAAAVAVPVCAQLATMPEIVVISGEISLVSIFANLVTAPAVAPATIAGMLAGLVRLVLSDAATLPAILAKASAFFIVQTARFSAAAEGSQVTWSLPFVALVAVVPALAGFLWWLAPRPVPALIAVGVLVVGIVRPASAWWPPPGTVMVACDVGQGDSTVLVTGRGSAIVVDVGEDPTRVDDCLRRLGVERIDVLVFTHDDADHVAGWIGAVRGRSVGLVVVGPSGGPEVPAVGRRVVRAGDEFAIGAVRVDVLWPGSTPLSDQNNDQSVVLRVESGGVRFLLAADLGAEAQEALLRTGTDVSADVLKLSHHGSADQSARFLAAVDAGLVTVSVGADNEYGHPARSTLDLLESSACVVRRTDLDHDVAVVQGTHGLSVQGR